MRIEYRIGMYILGALIVILMSVYTVDLLYFTRFPAVAPFGAGMLVLFIFLDALLVVCEGKTPQVVTNVGHFSINVTKDIYDIPWQVDTVEDKIKSLNLLNMRIMMVGGIDYWGISIHSSSDKPIIIAPSIFYHKEENNYACYANFEKYEIDELPMYIQYFLKRHFPGRVKEKTAIYYSEVSHMDGSAIPTNMKVLKLQKEENKEQSEYQKRLIRLYDEMNRGEKRKMRIFVKKELEEVNDDDSTG